MGEKAYTIAIDLGKVCNTKLREISQQFMQAIQYTTNHIPRWLEGFQMLTNVVAEFEQHISRADRDYLVKSLYNLMEV